jgi:hypothetical protein
MAKLKYSAAVTVYRDYDIEVEAESKDDAYSIIKYMDPEELEAKGELSSWEVWTDSIYLDDSGAEEVLGKQKEMMRSKKEFGAVNDAIEAIEEKYQKMADEEIHARMDELKIDQLQRRILWNQREIMKLDVNNPHKESYRNSRLTEIEDMITEIDGIRGKQKAKEFKSTTHEQCKTDIVRDYDPINDDFWDTELDIEIVKAEKQEYSSMEEKWDDYLSKMDEGIITYEELLELRQEFVKMLNKKQ